MGRSPSLFPDNGLIEMEGGPSPFTKPSAFSTWCVSEKWKRCHTLPTGTNGELTSAGLILDTQSMKIPQLRNLYEKTGFDDGSMQSNRGFGFTHDGAEDALFDFLL